MTKPATAEALFLDDFAANGATLPGAGLPWLDTRRADAIKSFRAKGVPHRRIEEWKYSDLRTALEGANDYAIDRAVWSIEKLPTGVELFDLAELDKSPPEWVKRNFGSVAANQNAMEAASLALARAGVAIRIPREASIETALCLQFSRGGHCRALIVLEEGAALTLVESHPANESTIRNVGVEIALGADARLTHIRSGEVSVNGLQVEEISVRAEAGASYRAAFANFGAKLSRLELAIALTGEGAEAHVCGVSVLGSETHCDVTTHIDHAVGNTTSTQLFKLVAGGASRAIYQGKITVRAGANGSDSRQTAKALLLGAHAEADLKPELEILADDVKCAHGAAVGDLDAESLFYLRSRGVSEDQARDLLIRAFLEDALLEIQDEVLRMEIWREVERALPRAMESVA